MNTVRAQTGGKRLPDTIDETHILVVLAANGGYDHRLVREALQVAVEQGRLREVDGEYLVADDSDS